MDDNKKVGRRKGYIVTEETKSKISESMTGKSKTKEMRSRVSESMIGKKNALKYIVLDDLRAMYPEHVDFFEQHKDEINAWNDVKTDARIISDAIKEGGTVSKGKEDSLPISDTGEYKYPVEEDFDE